MSTSQQTATSWPAPLGRKGGLQTEHDLQDTCSRDGSALEASGFASCSGLKTCPYLSPPQQLSPHHTVNSFSPIPLPSLLSWVPQIPVVTSCSYRIYTLLPSITPSLPSPPPITPSLPVSPGLRVHSLPGTPRPWPACFTVPTLMCTFWTLPMLLSSHCTIWSLHALSGNPLACFFPL